AAMRCQYGFSIRPVLEESQDCLTTGTDQPRGCMPQAPTQRLGFGDAKTASETEALEPPYQCCRHANGSHPCAVGMKIRERKPLEAGVLLPANTVLNVGVRTHEAVDRHRFARAIRVEAPVTIVHGREERGLCTGVQRLPAHDQAGSFRPLR